ncbi:MAG: DUF3007 family protein [Synechococcus sp. ELA057]|jgi:hypothetical protein
MTRGQALLAGLGVFTIGGLGYWGFGRFGGLEGFDTGIAASVLLMAVVLIWTGSYLFRVVSGRMTYMEQRRTYRTAYDAATDAELLARFEALSPEEQQRLLAEVGQQGDSDPASQAAASASETPTP